MIDYQVTIEPWGVGEWFWSVESPELEWDGKRNKSWGGETHSRWLARHRATKSIRKDQRRRTWKAQPTETFTVPAERKRPTPGQIRKGGYMQRKPPSGPPPPPPLPSH